jgi:hypothetical protein
MTLLNSYHHLSPTSARDVSLYVNSRQRSEGKDMWQSMLVFSVLLPKYSGKFMSQTGKDMGSRTGLVEDACYVVK